MEHSTSRKSATPSTSSLTWEHDLAGESFDDFHVLRRLGEGGMGHVYLAEQLSLKRNVAIKVLRPDLTTPTALARFRAESTTIAQLSHANVVQAYTVGEHKGRHYLVLEYVDGVSLRDYLTKKGPLELPLVMSILRRVASALQRAGELGIIHRDIKPENILLTRKAEVKVADFGLARCLTADESLDLTRSGATVGTPRYMSPEQLEGKPVDQRCDIYSLGISFYEMLTGQQPFDGNTAFEIAIKHVREEAVPVEKLRPGLPPAVCALVRKMMAKNPDERPANARELLKDIARVRETLGDATAAVPTLPSADDVPEQEASPKPAPSKRDQTVSIRAGTAAETTEFPGGKARKSKTRRQRSLSAPVSLGQRLASRPWILGLGIAGAVLFLVVLVVVVAVSGTDDKPPSLTLTPPPGAAAKKQEEAASKKAREQALRKLAEPHLKDLLHPAGVDACINLGVFYLDEDKVRQAESVFKRMSERQPPSAYHFVGRLGLAVVDAVNKNDRAAEIKFKELFNAKSKDGRVRLLNEALEKHPQFAEWVNEADARDARHNVFGGSTHKTPRFPGGGFPSGKGYKFRRP